MPDKYFSAKPHALGASNDLIAANLRMARKRWGGLSPYCIQNLKTYSLEFHFSIVAGDLILLDNGWYITHQGLLSLARRKRCAGIHVKPAGPLCDPLLRRSGLRGNRLSIAHMQRFHWLRRCRSI